jgi:hypothetical protein
LDIVSTREITALKQVPAHSEGHTVLLCCTSLLLHTTACGRYPLATTACAASCELAFVPEQARFLERKQSDALYTVTGSFFCRRAEEPAFGEQQKKKLDASQKSRQSKLMASIKQSTSAQVTGS